MKVRVQMEQVRIEERDIFPGRARDIHQTCDVRSWIPKYRWQEAHRRTEGLRWSWLIHSAMSGGLKREVVGHTVRWALSRGVEPSQGQGGGVEVPMLSPGDHPLLERRRNKTEDSRREWRRWCLKPLRGGWV